MTKYYGMLSDEEIEWITQALDMVNKDNPCHTNAIIRAQLKEKLTTQFIEADHIVKPTLENKFVESISIQH